MGNKNKIDGATASAAQWGYTLITRPALIDDAEEVPYIFNDVIRLIVLAQTLTYLLDVKETPEEIEQSRLRFNHVVGWGVLVYQNSTNLLSAFCLSRMLSLAESHWRSIGRKYDSSAAKRILDRIGVDYTQQETQYSKHIPWSGPIFTQEDRQIALTTLDLLYDALWYVLNEYVHVFNEYTPEITQRFAAIKKGEKPRV